MPRPQTSLVSTLSLPAELKVRVETVAKTHRWSRSAAVRFLMEEGLSRYERGEFRPVQLPPAQLAYPPVAAE